MADDFSHTISGSLRKRADLISEAQPPSEKLAEIGNLIESQDRVLRSLGYDEQFHELHTRAKHTILIARNKLRRMRVAQLREAKGQPLTARVMTKKIMGLEGKDVGDRHMRNNGETGWQIAGAAAEAGTGRQHEEPQPLGVAAAQLESTPLRDFIVKPLGHFFAVPRHGNMLCLNRNGDYVWPKNCYAPPSRVTLTWIENTVPTRLSQHFCEPLGCRVSRGNIRP